MHHAIEHGLIHSTEQKKNLSEKCWMRKLNYEQILFIREKYNSLYLPKGMNIIFCKTIAEMFNLKSANTVIWVYSNETSKFVNQDIVQTTNFDEYNNQFNQIFNRLMSERKKLLIDYADELGVKRKSFHSAYRRFGKNLEKTIDYYKNQKR